MTAEATLRIRLGPQRAAQVAAALKPDDDAFVSARADGETLVVEFRASKPSSLGRAIEDVLANVAISEDLLRTPPFDDE